MANNEHEKVLEVKDLRISFKTLSGTVKAVRGINFTLYKGKTLAIVGESGSGKSVTSRAILGILANNKIVEGGQILYDGKDLLQLSEDQFTSIRGSKISMIFQDPLSSLNPIMKVGKQLTEPMFLKAKATRKEAKKIYKSYLNYLNIDLKDTEFDFNEFNNLMKEYALINSKADFIHDLELDLEDAKSNKGNDEKLNLKEEKLNEQLESLNSKLVESNKQLDDFFNDSHNVELIKSILTTRYQHYIESLKELKDEIGAYKEKYFITSFDYKTKIFTKIDELETLKNNHFNEIKDLNNQIDDVNLSLQSDPNNVELKSQLKDLNKQKNDIYQDYLDQSKDIKNELDNIIVFDDKNALKDINNIQKFINNCDYEYAVERDDIVSVFATSFKKYILEYQESIKLNNDEDKFQSKFDDFNNGERKEVPPSLRAKRRETIVPYYEFYETMINSIDNIIKYMDEYLLSQTFDVDVYYPSFIENLKKQVVLANTKVRKSEAKKRALELLHEVGIPEPERRYNQYPFEFSGGMRQRIVIAIALSSNPEILICDEPTTALDVTIQAQILELINKMKKDHNLSIIFITHDLGVVANMADDIAVMYAGKIVEYGSVYDIFYDPRHPYTWALLGSMPDLDTKEKLDAIPGTPPNMLLPPKGDAFAARNKYAMKIDYEAQPPFFKVSDSHYAATWLLHENAPDVKAPKVVVNRIKHSLKVNSDNKPVFENDKNSILKGGKQDDNK